MDCKIVHNLILPIAQHTIEREREREREKERKREKEKERERKRERDVFAVLKGFM
jgi:hypothetical protein